MVDPDLDVPRLATVCNASESLPMTVVLHAAWHACGRDACRDFGPARKGFPPQPF
jgi:hypothetical protein